MSMETAEFTAFGVLYRTTQFSAKVGFDLVGKMSEVHPSVALSKTQVFDEENEVWKDLTAANINAYVIDRSGMLPGLWVLRGVIEVVSSASFGFIIDWNQIKIPNRFLSNSEPVSVNGINPMISSLIQEGAATLKELEESYSLRDAFNLLDIMMAKTVNKLLGQEAAEYEAKNKYR